MHGKSFVSNGNIRYGNGIYAKRWEKSWFPEEIILDPGFLNTLYTLLNNIEFVLHASEIHVYVIANFDIMHITKVIKFKHQLF